MQWIYLEKWWILTIFSWDTFAWDLFPKLKIPNVKYYMFKLKLGKASERTSKNWD